MSFILDPAVHVNAALFAAMPLNRCFGIHNFEFFSVSYYGEVFTRDNEQPVRMMPLGFHTSYNRIRDCARIVP